MSGKEYQRLIDHNKQLEYEREGRKKEGFGMMKSIEAGLAR